MMKSIFPSDPHLTQDPKNRDAQQKPQKGKKRTDLTPQISPVGAVVPNIPVKVSVAYQAKAQFHAGNENSACGAAHKKRKPMHPIIQRVEPQKTYTACQKHGPVGESSKQDLDPPVTQCTGKKQYHMTLQIGPHSL